MSAPAIEVTGLVKIYDGLVAVDHLDLVIPRGQTLALLGPNGAGKTSTIECCEGHRRPDAGTVRVLGLDPATQGDALAPRIGVMLQEGGLYPQARPLEVLRLFASFFADPLEPDALFGHLGLAGTERTSVRDLSGGQRQRLALACALVGRPEVVFLDEPTAGLDPQARRQTWEHVRHLQRDGVTIVLTTHLLDEAEELADRVVILDAGRIVADGTPAELTQGQHGLMTFTSTPGIAVDDLGAALGVEVRSPRPGTYEVLAEGTPELVVSLATWLAGQGHRIGQLNAGQRSLEDVFLALTEDVAADGSAPGVVVGEAS